MNTTRRAATLPVAFFDRDVTVVARDLLGALVVSTVGGERTAGRIVETEAYLGREDPASHGYQDRRNERNVALFGPPGTWYVYLSYGVHWCTNLACGPEGTAGAVLLRALEPVEGLEVMRRRRGGVDDRHLCSGPGKLCQAPRHHPCARWNPDAAVVSRGAPGHGAEPQRHRGDAPDRHHQSGRLAAEILCGRQPVRVGATRTGCAGAELDSEVTAK